ncbi:unnamed protein product [Brachionus calyciflorus]|uniref:Mediator of RNA polymerase II transcription subunit 31 n=1 Tax=Brachionus calyciflorus TaxID=104777 RepID=A0A813M9S5_9BILA|nr:unnamed protein product [Brachionus calyciflorus]
MSSSSGTPMGNPVVQGNVATPNPIGPPQYYQSRYPNPMSVQSVPSPAPINSPMIPIQQQQQLAPPYQSINSPNVNQQPPPPNYQHNLNSPMAPHVQQHTQSPMMPQSVQSQHLYSPMPTNQLNSNLNSPLTHQYQINSPMPNQSPITTNTPQQHYQSMSINSPHPPLTPQQQQYHQQMHHSNSSIPSTPTMMVNSPYNNNSYNQYNHHYQSQDQFNTSQNYQQQQQHNYDLNYMDNTDYYNQQYMLKQQQQQQQQQQQLRERERELEKEREQKRKELNEKQQRKRFLVELEFVQCLANPNYLHYLAKQGMFENDSFKNYLKYLLYWKRPEYIQFIRYPECLFFLDLLQNDELQQMIKDKNCVNFICEQQMYQHKYHNNNQENFLKTVKAMNSSTKIKQDTDITENNINNTQGVVSINNSEKLADEIKKLNSQKNINSTRSNSISKSKS